MGNALWCCCKGEDDDDVGDVYRGGHDQYAYYYPAPAPAAASCRPHHYVPAAVSSPTPASSLLRFQSPPSPPSRPQRPLHVVPQGVAVASSASTSRSSLILRPQPPPAAAAPPSRPQGVAVASSASTSRSSLILRPQLPPAAAAPPSRPQGVAVASSASTSRSSLILRPQLPPAAAAAPPSRPQRQLHAPPPVPVGAASSTSTSRSRIVPFHSQPAPVPAPRPKQRLHPPPTVPHGDALASPTPSCVVLRPQKQKLRQPPHGVDNAVTTSAPTTTGLLRFEHDLLHFVLTKMVPEGLGKHVTKSSKKAQAKWYRKISEAYVRTEPPPKTSAEAAMLVATALSRIHGANLEGVLAFYGFGIPTPPLVTTEHRPSSLPQGVQFVLNTLPVFTKCIGDGDGFTAYVDTADPSESTNVPQEVREAVIAMARTPKLRKSQMKNVLQIKLNKAGYRIIYTSKDEILARQYRFRLRGIDAPEMGMQYGKESQDALVKFIAGKSVIVYVYGQDKYNRYVGDIYCGGVFIQEHMLKEGHAWHYKIYDKRPEFAEWEMKARHARQGLWASDNPEKPWDWKRKHNVRHEKTSDNPDKKMEWRKKTAQCEIQEHPISVILMDLNLEWRALE